MNYRKELDKVKPYVPGKPIEEVRREFNLKQIYKLASNEIPFSPDYLSKTVLKELKKINQYPESGCFYLRQYLAKQLSVDPGQIVFGNGSDDIIGMVMRAFVSKNDEVVLGFPTFLIYEIQSRVQGAKVVEIGLKNFKYDLDAMAKAITPQTKIVFIANPDNPTGSYVNHAELKKFLNKIPKNVLVFLDEAYFEFAPKDFPKSLELLRSRGNIFVSRTFSKAYGLAGLRIGFAVTTLELAGCLEKVREPFNINRFAQVCALEALKNKSVLKRNIEYIAKEKKYLYAEFKKNKVKFYPSATNFILIDFGADTTQLNQWLIKNGIIIRQLRGWGLAKFYRVTIGLHKENKKFVACLKQFLKNSQ